MEYNAYCWERALQWAALIPSTKDPGSQPSDRCGSTTGLTLVSRITSEDKLLLKLRVAEEDIKRIQ